MNLNQVLDPNSPVLISMPIIFGLFKVLFLIAFSLYVLYALIIVRQISLMSRTITTNLEGLLKLAAWGHLIGAILIWIMAFVARA